MIKQTWSKVRRMGCHCMPLRCMLYCSWIIPTSSLGQKNVECFFLGWDPGGNSVYKGKAWNSFKMSWPFGKGLALHPSIELLGYSNCSPWKWVSSEGALEPFFWTGTWVLPSATSWKNIHVHYSDRKQIFSCFLTTASGFQYHHPVYFQFTCPTQTRGWGESLRWLLSNLLSVSEGSFYPPWN